MRKRYIQPGFFTNEQLSELDPKVRILFAGLWVIADREGRLQDRPKRIKAQLFPYDDDININDALNLLAQKSDNIAQKGYDPFIIRYEVDGMKYIQITKWESHQSPHPKEVASILPKPKHKSSKGHARRRHKRSMPHASLELELESESELKEKEVVSEAFDSFWSTYPRKVGKGEARTAFAKALSKLNARGSSPEFLLERVRVFAASPAGKSGKYTPHPASWLNKERYDDDPADWNRRDTDDRIGPGQQFDPSTASDDPASVLGFGD